MLQKVEENELKNNTFLEKFKGKMSRVPRMGINAVFLKE